MNSKKLVALLAATAMTAGMVAGCGSSTDTAASTAASTASSEATSEAVTSEAAASSEAAETSESATTEEASADADQLPRDQTLYFSGQQWGSVNDYNPLSGNSNNGMVLAASTFSRILVYETLMMYDPLTTECKPLLATDYSWNDDHTEMTVHLNPDAKWSDGTQVTSADIAYTVCGENRLDMNYVVLQKGRKTDSRVDALGVLRDHAFKLFRGTIDFKNGSCESVGNEKENVLLLDEDVVNQTIPLILCAEEDVEGNHGATIGELDADTLFYLETRGIPREEVSEMVARGRMDSVIRMIPDEKTRNALLGSES